MAEAGPPEESRIVIITAEEAESRADPYPGSRVGVRKASPERTPRSGDVASEAPQSRAWGHPQSAL